ncbi:hypothetical protein T4E_3207, partial [Trichinella pseudospiralis]
LIMEHGRGFALFTLLVVTVVLCIDQANALKCELVGCRFCVTRRMQTHCSAFCATCPNESQRKEQSPSTLIGESSSGSKISTPIDRQQVTPSVNRTVFVFLFCSSELNRQIFLLFFLFLLLLQ